MIIDQIKKGANDILENGLSECSYIEYKTSISQLDKILKTICAYGNNYYDNDIQYIFIGVEEINDLDNKAIPSLPINGIKEGSLEKYKNQINSLRPFLYPNVKFEIITNNYKGQNYILIVVERQTGGPFMVSEKAEKNKGINLKAGRYIRIEAETRLANPYEEYDLLRKFANFHFSSITNSDATIEDLNVDFMKEYIAKTSSRDISETLDKQQMARMLGLIDKNDPNNKKIKNYALLMFGDKPEEFIPNCYIELIVDMFDTKRKMESKNFTGPIWRQYNYVTEYIRDNFLSTLIIRDDDAAINRKIENFPFVAIEELVANAIVHNNYENFKAIQIYISKNQINIVNYNSPLPPLKINDLNERSFFNERDTENPEIRDMFKAIGIIESFGTGIKEAKNSLKKNGSPNLYYKTFDNSVSITSVVIPVNEEFYETKYSFDPIEPLIVKEETRDIEQIISSSSYEINVKRNLLILYKELKNEIIGNNIIMKTLNCSEATATSYIKKLHESLHIVVPVIGSGKGKYRFIK